MFYLYISILSRFSAFWEWLDLQIRIKINVSKVNLLRKCDSNIP